MGQVISRITTVALAAATCLAFTGVARADDVPPATRFAVGSPAMQLALGIAQANWGMDACGGQVTIEWGADEANINARSYWANPLSSYDNPDQNTQCRIVFNATMSFTWVKFCTVLVHEYGHLTGHPHGADGPDVMSPIYRAPLPACVASDPTGQPAAPAPTTISTTVTTPAASVVEAPVTRTAKRRGRNADKAPAGQRARGRARARLAAV